MSNKAKAVAAFVVLMFVGFGLAVASSVVAHADSNDDGYVMALHMGGIQASPSSLISLGHEICRAASKGMTDNQIAVPIMSGGDFTRIQTYYMIGAAEAAYCPAYASRGLNDVGTGGS